MDEILVKYLLGEASEQEVKEIDEWLREKEANQKYFDDFRFIWDESHRVALKSNADENAAWRRFESMIENKNGAVPARVIPMRETKGFSWRKMAIAASILLTIGIASYFYFSFSSMTAIAATDQVVSKTLADHSVITLNKDSKLTYGKYFNQKDRQVTLSGEAFFNIAPDRQKPFIIHTGDITVTVVGTSFNINTMTTGTEVIVETGIVTVQVKDQVAKLVRGQKIFISKSTDKLEVEDNRDQFYNYYRTNEFICNNTPLSTLVEALNRNYNAHIKITNPNVANLRLTTRFSKESLDNVLDIVSETLNVQVVHEGNGTILIK